MTTSVLLVEDNEHNRYLLSYLLERHGYRVRTVSDGVAALRAAQAEVPAVILLDIQLPGMDGYAVARALRALAGLGSVPILAVTSYAMPGDRDRALAAGCTGYLEKPIDPSTFVAQVEAAAGLPRRPASPPDSP